MQINIARIENDFPVGEFANKNWEIAEDVSAEKYWSGADAPLGRHFKTKLLWSANAFYVRFEANQTEPLVVSETPVLDTKTNELWNRDVCEIFVAPNRAESNKYFEFEIAPTGEWLDLAIRQMPAARETDFDYSSEMKSAASIEIGKVFMALKIEWKAFGLIPQPDDIWKGNFFRCVGSGARRGYLAWQPTRTATPDFHVPEAFGEFKFVK